MSTAQLKSAQRKSPPARRRVSGPVPILLEDVSWKAYEALLESWQERHLRLTYDNGRLEIMSPLSPHERYKKVIARLIEVYTFEFLIPLCPGGSTTFRKKARRRGLEPDECYWIQNATQMISRREFDPKKDPPPDLAIEIDTTTSSLDRMSIYATLGVPEIWRFDDGRLTINVLQEDGSYLQVKQSVALPGLAIETIDRYLADAFQFDLTELTQRFLKSLRASKPTRKE